MTASQVELKCAYFNLVSVFANEKYLTDRRLVESVVDILNHREGVFVNILILIIVVCHFQIQYQKAK